MRRATLPELRPRVCLRADSEGSAELSETALSARRARSRRLCDPASLEAAEDDDDDEEDEGEGEAEEEAEEDLARLAGRVTALPREGAAAAPVPAVTGLGLAPCAAELREV